MKRDDGTVLAIKQLTIYHKVPSNYDQFPLINDNFHKILLNTVLIEDNSLNDNSSLKWYRYLSIYYSL